MQGNGPGLQGRTVWVTRPREQSDRLCVLLRDNGAHAVRFPVITIEPVTPAPDASAVLALLAEVQLLVFVSVNAVDYADRAVPGFFDSLGGKQVLALGAATRQALYDRGVGQAECADGVGSDALLGSGSLNPAALENKRVLIVRGVGGRQAIIDHLQANGIQVDCLEVYQRSCPGLDQEAVDKLWQDSPPDAVVVTSVEGLHNLIKMVGETYNSELMQTPLVVMSERIGSYAAEMGFSCKPGVATAASDKGLVNAVEIIFGVQSK